MEDNTANLTKYYERTDKCWGKYAYPPRGVFTVDHIDVLSISLNR